MTVLPIVNGALGTITSGLVKGLGRLRNQMTSGGYLNCRIAEIGHNTKKNLGDLWRIADTQIPVKTNQFTLV